MKLQVKYDELDDLGSFVKEKKDSIDKILENVLKAFNEVPEAWQGEDSDAFMQSANEAIDNEKERNNKLEILSNILKYAAKNYKQEDEEWLEIIKKEEISV